MLTVVLNFVTLQTNHTLQKGSLIWQEKMRVSLKGQKQGQQTAKNRLTQCTKVPMLHTLVRHHSVWFTAKRTQTITLCRRQSQPLVEEIQLCFSSEPWERSCTVKVSSVWCKPIGQFPELPFASVSKWVFVWNHEYENVCAFTFSLMQIKLIFI